MLIQQRHHSPTHSSIQGGFSLVEIMVSVTIGLILMVGMTTLVLNTSRTYHELNKVSQQVENGRYALQLLATEIQHAGFFGELMELENPPGTLPNPCSVGTTSSDLSSMKTALTLPIHGYDGPTESGQIPSCVTDAGHVPNTDVLVLRRAETVEADVADLDATEIYLQSSPTDFELGMSTDISGSVWAYDGAPYPIRRYRTDIYFIGQVDGSPALRRLELQAGELIAMTLVEGIEDLQFDFGIDRNGDGAPNGSGGSEAYVALPGTTEEWQNVVALRLHLLARNPEPTQSFIDSKTYVLGIDTNGGPYVVTPGGSYKRHVYSSVVRAVNRSMRRE